ncbi:MAG TPA: lipoyl domain-containing protein [Dongiaceae bacterium]|jgi:pyruvate/2-oxoglutarate dehydrogenase complex dihydrolipoamide acyltransferase (E2) component|nr:lipoyl domain-containing protein [Dongiaceae bacterium]
MSTPVPVPRDLWEEDLPGIVSAWLFEDGDTVSEGDLIAELMVEKTSYDLTAPKAGRLRILVQPEIPFQRGDVIASIE